MSRVLALDPGNTFTGWCVIERDTLKPLSFGKTENRSLAQEVKSRLQFDEFVIERVASYGMAVGKDIFQTCEWIGRFVQIASDRKIPVSYVYRKDEKLHVCGDSRAKDSNIRMALVERFAQHDFKNGKGTKADPDWFYGFSGSDMYAAYCVGITYIEKGPSEKEDAYED